MPTNLQKANQFTGMHLRNKPIKLIDLANGILSLELKTEE